MYNFAFFPLVLLLIYNVLIIYRDSAALIEEKILKSAGCHAA